MKAKLIVVGMAVAALSAVAMPTKTELNLAEKLVRKTMQAEQKALDARKKTRGEVAAKAVELAEKAETEAERLLYLKGAFELYAKDGNAEKAIETVGMIRTQIPDIPPENLSNIIKSGVRSADKKTKASIAAFWDEIKSREAARKLVAGDVPKVLKTVPANGDRKVDPATSTIVIAFDQPMGGGYALCRGVGVSWNESPETVGKPVWNAAKTTIAFPVKLRSGWHYKMSINREDANSFRNAKGVPVPDTDYEFWTTGKAEPMTDLPKVVKISPANGAKDVDPKTDKIVVTFSEEMEDGCWSVCRSNAGTWDDYPKCGKISYDATHTVLTIPVSLVPGKTYKLQLNNGDACSFMNKAGKSLMDYPYTFTTKAR